MVDEPFRSSMVLWCVLVMCAFLTMVNAAQLEGSGQGYYDKNGQDIVSGSPVHAGEGSSVLPKPNVSVSGTSENAPEGVQQFVAAMKQTTVSFGEDVEVTVENIYTNTTTFDGVMPMENVTDCTGYQLLADQPVFTGPSVNFIRKCCPQGQRMVHDGVNIISCQQEGPRTNRSTMSAIVAKFYDGCVEDLEEDAGLGFVYGNPCVTERGLVSYGPHFMDTLYVIQNGSLLVIYKRPYDIEVFNSYCLDYRVSDATIVAYVCPEEISLGADVVAGQLILLTVCLIFAIPLLVLTATFYLVIPELHDLHGKALAMNCVNFAIALLLESFFQHKASGKRMNGDQIVLKNSAEYFILATFFWLLVNCANNCFHAWFYAPRAKDVTARWDRCRFIGYALVAQLVPLWIILSFSITPQGNPAIKNYLFRTIMVILVLTLVCLIACYAGLRRVVHLYTLYNEVRQRLLDRGQEFNVEQMAPTHIPAEKINKVIYMTNYTALLYFVMAFVWVVMTVSYYTTYKLPIFYDILFSLQGIVMFIIFVCLPKPRGAVKRWFRERTSVQPTECQPGDPAPLQTSASATIAAPFNWTQRRTNPPTHCDPAANLKPAREQNLHEQ